MLKKIFVLSVLSAIILVSLIGVVSAYPGMLTYTNEEYGFSIEYPKDWTVKEEMGYAMFMGPIKDTFIVNVNVGTEELPTKMTAEEYAKAVRAGLTEELNVVKTLNGTINGEPVAVHILTKMMEGVEIKLMQACFVSGTTAYVITFTAASSTYNEAEDDYFDPMLQSFKFIEKEVGIEIRTFIVTPSKVETGEEVKVKFEAVNEADVQKTKTFHLVDDPSGFELIELPKEIDFKTVTLASGETEVIEFTFIPKEVGEHVLYVEGQHRIIEVTEAKFIEKEAGIEIRTFIVTPSKVETGEEVKVKFEAVNEADVQKTKTFHLVDDPSGFELIELPKEIDFKTVTLASGEIEIIEFTFIPKEVGEHVLSVEGQHSIIEVTEARPKEEREEPGFEAVFAITGLLGVAYLLRRRK